MVGAALKGRRDKVYISTKSGAGTKEDALAHLDESLKQLGTDHVDIWYLHGKSKAADIKDELVEAQQIAKQAGKIRFAGVSLHSGHAEVIPAAIAKKMDVVLVTYNFTMADRNDALMQSLHDAGVGVVAMKVMAGGRGPEAVAMREKMAAQGAFLSALKWTLRKPFVHTTIPSTTDMAQLDENLKAMAEPWSAGRREEARRAARADPPRLLLDVRAVRGDLPEGAAGRGHAALPDLRRGLRPVRARPRELPRRCRPPCATCAAATAPAARCTARNGVQVVAPARPGPGPVRLT